MSPKSKPLHHFQVGGFLILPASSWSPVAMQVESHRDEVATMRTRHLGRCPIKRAAEQTNDSPTGQSSSGHSSAIADQSAQTVVPNARASPAEASTL